MCAFGDVLIKYVVYVCRFVALNEYLIFQVLIVLGHCHPRLLCS